MLQARFSIIPSNENAEHNTRADLWEPRSLLSMERLQAAPKCSSVLTFAPEQPPRLMRKELGKPTREYFFARLAEIAPDFQRCSTYDIKGFTWSFLRRQNDLYQWLWFQRHMYDDAFTVELSWSCLTEEPTRPPIRDPSDAFTPEGARFRLGRFWNSGGDYWWYIADPPPSISEVTPEEYVNRLLAPRPEVDLGKVMPKLRATVDDVIVRIQEHALPYFNRVALWA